LEKQKKILSKTVSNAMAQFPEEELIQINLAERPMIYSTDEGRMPRPFFSKQVGQGGVGLAA